MRGEMVFAGFGRQNSRRPADGEKTNRINFAQGDPAFFGAIRGLISNYWKN